MITILNEETKKAYAFTNDYLNIISDALLHEMERYNNAMELCTDARVQEACKSAKRRINELHSNICRIMPDDK